MSDWDRIGFTQQGWQCPICKRVYSPSTSMCLYCWDAKTENVPSTTGTPLVDWSRTTSTTVPKWSSETITVRKNKE